MENFLKIAVVGAGLIGKRHIDAVLRCKGAKLAAIVEPAEEAQDYIKQTKRPWYPSIKEAFAAGELHGVILATPNNMHLKHGQEVINQGCPLLIEKPIASVSSEGQVLVDLAKKNKVPLLVGHHRRHNPLIRKAYSAIQSGKLGRIRSVQATCWLYKTEDYFEESPWRKRKGAGPIAVNLIHDIDLIRHLCGEIKSVYAQTSPSLRGHENEDIACAVLRLANDALCTISVSDTVVAPWSWELTSHEYAKYPPTKESCYLIGGTHGSLSLPDLRLWSNEGERSWWNPIQATTITRDTEEPLLNQVKQFIAVIKGEEQATVSGEEGLKSLKVIEAIGQSAQSNQPVLVE